MKFELGYIESLIESKEFLSPVDDAAAQCSSQVLSSEVARVRIAIKDSVFACQKTAMIKRYIRDTQQVLLGLLNRVLTAGGGRSFSVDGQTLTFPLSYYSDIYRQLEQLLLHIETYFGRYFDSALDVPAGYATALVHDVSVVLVLIKQALVKHDVDATIIQVICEPIEAFLNNTVPNARTYQSLRYMKELTADLMRVCCMTEQGVSLQQGIIDLLYYHNVNTPRFFQYHTERITKRVEDAVDHLERVEVYTYEAKVVRQAVCRADVAYECRNKSIKELLTIWLEEELKYLHERQQYQLPFGGGQEALPTRDYKLSIGISVAQLACIVRAMVETGVIQNKNIMELARFIPEIMKVKHKESFSHVSFRLKYYNVESGTCQSVIDTLQQMTDAVSTYDQRLIR
jgi:hypothetical protein